jgi:nitrogen regulation protein NR(I)
MTEKPRVLIADDELNLRRVLKAMLRRAGYAVEAAEDGLEALEKAVAAEPFDVVITDLKMPRMDGMELLRVLSAEHPDTPVVMITAHGSVESAVEAVKSGAFDYIEKPFEQEQILQVIGKATRTAAHQRQHARSVVTGMDGEVDPARGRFGLIGSSPAMQELHTIIERVADTPSTVLITGESGTGKELVAKALHRLSARSDAPFIKINCAAIPETLIESELFGHEKGAFTGATSSKPGRFELADGGTLLLDEVGEVPPPMQVKLLRALQESEFERVGGVKTIRVDVRLIAATNMDLEQEIGAGRFREDLYYRLNVVPLRMSALRQRAEDVPELAAHFLKRFNEKLNRSVEGFSEAAIEALRRYPWPGNIRELENVVERTVLFCDSAQIAWENLPAEVRSATGASSAVEERVSVAAHGAQDGPELPPFGDVGEKSLKDVVKTETKRLEKEMIQRALNETDGNVTRAAKLLGISRKGLQIKMKELGLRHQ